ncbi:MAG: LPS export ABC transporter periplasmic protein LptC [Bdellovibrionia bacterium]
MGIRKTQVRPLLLLGALGAIIIKWVFGLSAPFSAPFDDTRTSKPLAPSPLLMLDQEASLIPGFPQPERAEHTVEQFKHVSIQNGEKQWRIEAQKAFFYTRQKLVHVRTAQAFLYDREGKITTVSGDEARYSMHPKDLEIFGHVKTILPDGFEINSEYMRYRPETRRLEIPKNQAVHGLSHSIEPQGPGQTLEFWSHGLIYSMKDSIVDLQDQVQVTLIPHPANASSPPEERTTLHSDHCQIDRKNNLARFSMNPHRPVSLRFVHIVQPNLWTRARSADLYYGDFSRALRYLTTYDDVLIKELGEKDVLKYATSGRADFDRKNRAIILRDFPQVYQNQNTVTGDQITLHQDTDIVDVENSNAFSQGTD